MIPIAISILPNNFEYTFNAYHFTSQENIDRRKTLLLNLYMFGNFGIVELCQSNVYDSGLGVEQPR